MSQAPSITRRVLFFKSCERFLYKMFRPPTRSFVKSHLQSGAEEKITVTEERNTKELDNVGKG